MKVILRPRTAARLMKTEALEGYDVSAWRAHGGNVVLSVMRAGDPEGKHAREALRLAWEQTFKKRKGVV